MKKQLEDFKYAAFFPETAQNKLSIDRATERAQGFSLS